jgi:4-alpha-glucanotransferase
VNTTPSPLDRRSSGLLLHLTSLPGPHAAGDLGPAAHAFADWLAAAGQSWWQMLPVGPPGACYSPYDSPSSFAGSPWLISLELLAREGLLPKQALAPERGLSGARARFDRSEAFREPRLRRAFEQFRSRPAKRLVRELERFREQSRAWLGDYALFSALKQAHRGAPWWQWEAPLRDRKPAELARAGRQLAGEVAYHELLQLLFDLQWRELASHCRERGISLLGDMPMFVAHDGADCWANRDLFFLDRLGRRTVVAGVPPDAFSADGQLWGNPLYRWKRLEKTGFSWWISRLRTTLGRFDAVRLDHFIAFRRYWEVRAGARTAQQGRFVRVPGEAFFEAVRRELGGLPFLAEDLGLVTPEVHELRQRFGMPGMRVLMFAFAGEGSDYLPHRYPRRTVVYTGTHDNDTVRGWFRSLQSGGERGRKERTRLLRYLGTSGREIHWDVIRLAAMSVANVAIYPMQDVLGLGSDARMNVPGTVERNWNWRLPAGALKPNLATRLGELTRSYERG